MRRIWNAALTTGMLGCIIMMPAEIVHAQSEPRPPNAVRVPHPASEQEQRLADLSKDTLEITARSFFTLLQYPNAQLRGVVAISSETRIVLLKRTGKPLYIVGEDKVRRFLTTLFPVDGTVTFRFAAPVVTNNGPYGRVSRRFSVLENGGRTECMTFYGDAVRDGRNWSFTQMTFVPDQREVECDLIEG